MTQEKENLIAELETLLEDHQTYIKVLEVYFKDPNAINNSLNDVYIHITKKLLSSVDSKNLKKFQISIYQPIKSDLYGLEAGWDATNYKLMSHGAITSPFSWDFIRPYLYETHSHIARLLHNLKENDSLADIEKTIEKLKEDNEERSHFYIRKEGDDFYYKGRLIKISKDKYPYKVFSILYARKREGGEVSYKELIPDIKVKIPEYKNKSNTEIQKFIVSKLTDKTNGFIHYAEIDPREDNQKPLLSISWGKGIFFNNKAG
jgi:hypothetical protein